MAEPVILRQRWSCSLCGASGEVECSSRDDAAMVYDYVRDAHQRQSPECRSLARFGARSPMQQQRAATVDGAAAGHPD